MTEQALAGKRAIVVGGGSGIGLGSARLLAHNGASVTIVGRTEQKLADAQEALAAEGLTVHYCPCDGLDGASVQAAVDAASDDGGALHITVVVPGGGSIKPVLLFGDDEFSEQVDLNVRPVYLMLKYTRAERCCGPARARSSRSRRPPRCSRRAIFASYCAGKAAVDHLVRVAADGSASTASVSTASSPA